MTSEPKELELTPDLLEYAKAVALKEGPMVRDVQQSGIKADNGCVGGVGIPG